MDNKVMITLLANAGLLIQYEEYTILLDALQRSEKVPFSPLPTDIWQEILCGDKQFSKVDALLFTHLHPDHFCADMTLQYLKQHTAPVVMIPKDFTVSGTDEVLAQAGSRLIALAHDKPVRYVLSAEISVLAIPARHLDKRYHGVPHYCFLLSFGGKNILITADIDYTYETLSALNGLTLDAVFINPLFFSALCSNRFFKGTLNTKLFCVYHVPFISDDTMNIRSSVDRSISHWHGKPPITVLDQPLQQIII